MSTITITSFGYRHGPAPEATIILDLRELLYDPHVDPRMRELTGLDPEIGARVTATPAAMELLAGASRLALSLSAATRRPVGIAFGCAGGRHRSVVLAEELARGLRVAGLDVELQHRDIGLPVLAAR